MAEDPLADVVEADLAEQRRSELGLAADLGPLLVGKRTLLVEDRGRELIAPDPAYQSGEAHPGDLFLAQSQLPGCELG